MLHNDGPLDGKLGREHPAFGGEGLHDGDVLGDLVFLDPGEGLPTETC